MIYNEFMPTTDRMDYTAASSNNHAFAYGVETLLGVEVPRRAKVIRTILLELNRIISHFLFMATGGLQVAALLLLRKEGVLCLVVGCGICLLTPFQRCSCTA